MSEMTSSNGIAHQLLAQENAALRARIEELEQQLEKSKKNEVGLNGMLHLSKKALAKPCINCGYEQKVVRSEAVK